MCNLEFGEIWSFIKKHTDQSFYDSVYIPDEKDWEIIKDDLLSESKYRIKKHADIAALLPRKSYDMIDFFDEVCYENNILYPKKEKLHELYDKELGLDKWIQ